MAYWGLYIWPACGPAVSINMPFPMTRGLFYQHVLTLIPMWISNYIHYELWDKITYPFPNFNCAAVEVWEWISNFMPYFTGHVITYPYWD